MKRPKVKVCGMTRQEDVSLCSGLGAHFLGFIFHEGSPRNVRRDFAAGADAGSAAKVGVFVRQTADEVKEIIRECGLDYAQLHGGQDEEFCDAVGPDRVIKVLWPEKYDSPEALQADIVRFAPHCSHLLFDTGKSGGGHGRAMNLDIFQSIAIPKPWFLAGGLCAENTHAALQVEPDVLDLNSGVEAAPGIKDENKLRAVMQKLSEAS